MTSIIKLRRSKKQIPELLPCHSLNNFVKKVAKRVAKRVVKRVVKRVAKRVI
jgi:hypothetical protein